MRINTHISQHISGPCSSNPCCIKNTVTQNLLRATEYSVVSWVCETVRTHPITQINLTVKNYCSIKLLREKKMPENDQDLNLCLSFRRPPLSPAVLHFLLQASRLLPAWEAGGKRSHSFIQQICGSTMAPVPAVTLSMQVMVRRKDWRDEGSYLACSSTWSSPCNACLRAAAFTDGHCKHVLPPVAAPGLHT